MNWWEFLFCAPKFNVLKIGIPPSKPTYNTPWWMNSMVLGEAVQNLQRGSFNNNKAFLNLILSWDPICLTTNKLYILPSNVNFYNERDTNQTFLTMSIKWVAKNWTLFNSVNYLNAKIFTVLKLWYVNLFREIKWRKRFFVKSENVSIYEFWILKLNLRDKLRYVVKIIHRNTAIYKELQIIKEVHWMK